VILRATLHYIIVYIILGQIDRSNDDAVLSVDGMWLGHAHMQTTEIYTRVDPSVKLEALESVVPPELRSGRFKATDKPIASLRAVTLMRSKKP
jgi:hypothetical protein